MNTPTESEEQPTPSELGALLAATRWLLLAGVTGDQDRVASEVMRIAGNGIEVTAFVLGALTKRAAAAVVREHGSREAAIAAVNAEIVAAELQAAGEAE
ncbi:hypothetical protein [Mycobacterium sp. HNNTM2301]|uniref:hypothetical protein n=1 Tax=Mycobacterium hainanense TaxID=3289775 RepID=UPI0035A6ADB3